MEKRLILAIVLSFLIIFLWQAVFLKNKPQARPAVSGQTQKSEEGAAIPEAGRVAPSNQVPAEAGQTAQAGPAAETKAEAEQQVFIDTSLYRAVWSNKGGVLRSWKLKSHKDEKNEDLEIVPSLSGETGLYPFMLKTEDPASDAVLNGALFKQSSSKLSLRDGERGTVTFEYSDGKSLKVEKALEFEGGSYDFSLEIRLWRNGLRVEPRLIWGPGIGDNLLIQKRQAYGGASGSAVLAANKVFRMSGKKYRADQSVYNFVDWAAYEDNYTAALFLMPQAKGNAALLLEMRDKTPLLYLSVSPPERVFIGPKEMDTLKAFHPTAKRLINFGFFGAISEILLIGLRFFHRYVPNWGVAIILLTIVTKIIFFPLTYSSTKSMAKMQEIQPKIKALRAKYKKAKRDIAQRREMNEEMMKLYKEHGINPAGGCLPILIQLPIFWGFFRILVVAIELRRSPFVFWIKDLSVKDPFYVTPILMGVTQFISQKMTPSGADPAQARMMLLMPVVMTVFFMNFQSGLVLYWLTNNVLQIGQQYLMNRMMQKKRETHGKRREK